MTANGTLDERYLNWLVAQVEPITNLNPVRSHWLLCQELFKIEFTWTVPNDDNRLYDGLDIRQEFVDAEEGGEVPGVWLSEPCSFLEMLIALSRRLAFDTTPLEADYWFWEMLTNIGLREYVDETFDDRVGSLVRATVNVVIERTYGANGVGGIFPIKDPHKDQREVELWYQAQQYMMENIDV